MFVSLGRSKAAVRSDRCGGHVSAALIQKSWDQSPLCCYMKLITKLYHFLPLLLISLGLLTLSTPSRTNLEQPWCSTVRLTDSFWGKKNPKQHKDCWCPWSTAVLVHIFLNIPKKTLVCIWCLTLIMVRMRFKIMFD